MTEHEGYKDFGAEQREGSFSNTGISVKRKQKNLSVFDEYEQRGGVLEGYEDLNAASEEDDRVIS